VIPLIKEEQNRLKNDEKLYNLAFAHFSMSFWISSGCHGESNIVLK
jgi:hypothetical protein